MLLVDDDQAEVGEGQEQRRAGADHRARLAFRDCAPGALALALGEARVPLRRAVAEPGGESVEERAGQRDLGQQHQRLPPLPQRLGDRLEIDLRLAGAGDALEQRRRKGPVGDAGGEVVGGRLLFDVEDRRPMVRIEAGCDRLRRQRDERERAVLDEAVDHADRAAGKLGQRGLGDRRRAGRRPLIRPSGHLPPRGKGPAPLRPSPPGRGWPPEAAG